MATYADGTTIAEVGDIVKCIKPRLSECYALNGDCTYKVECVFDEYVALDGLSGRNVYSHRFVLIKRIGAVPFKQEPPMNEPLVDLVNHPPHYAGLSPEPVDVIEAWQLEWHEGNAMKYIARAKNKGERVQDLRKAAWYLNRKADVLEKNSARDT